jgi:hypothetical protein
MDNANNVYSIESTNVWNTPSKITYTYKGITYTNYLGNYWDDYKEKYPNAEERDSMGIWDTPYRIDSDSDQNPLVVPCENFAQTENVFETDLSVNPYPSISGTHTGMLTPNIRIEISTLYTYSCAGTGGHTKYARIWNDTWSGKEGYWEGYTGDWHNLTFDEPFMLFADKKYYYEIRTGSYPQIHHTSALSTASGRLNCTEFIDANGKKYYDWIPAIRLEGHK